MKYYKVIFSVSYATTNKKIDKVIEWYNRQFIDNKESFKEYYNIYVIKLIPNYNDKEFILYLKVQVKDKIDRLSYIEMLVDIDDDGNYPIEDNILVIPKIKSIISIKKNNI
jgi:hypothetical protein